MTNILSYMGDLSLRATEGLGINPEDSDSSETRRAENVLDVDKKPDHFANAISKNKNS